MKGINSKIVAVALLNGLDEARLLDNIKAKILDRDEFDNDEIYTIACDVFQKTSEEYFVLAFQVIGSIFSKDLLSYPRDGQHIIP